MQKATLATRLRFSYSFAIAQALLGRLRKRSPQPRQIAAQGRLAMGKSARA